MGGKMRKPRMPSRRKSAPLFPMEMQHVEYLRERLIPDLKESGRDATAEDIEEVLEIVDRLAEELECMLRGISNLCIDGHGGMHRKAGG